MAKFIELIPNKTYASEKNAKDAVEKLFPDVPVRYFVKTDHRGRYYPVFIGTEALDHGIHFHFNVVG